MVAVQARGEKLSRDRFSFSSEYACLSSCSCRFSASICAIFRRGNIPLPSAAKAATLLVMTEVMIPNPSVKTPAMHAIFGARISCQLRRTLRSKSRAISCRSHSLERPSSRNTIWAVSVAIDDAPGARSRR